MTIINEPRYKDFNGKIHRTKKECINAENNLVGNAFQMFEQLVIGCKNQNNCDDCPFFYNVLQICSIEEKIGSRPTDWKLEEEE